MNRKNTCHRCNNDYISLCDLYNKSPFDYLYGHNVDLCNESLNNTHCKEDNICNCNIKLLEIFIMLMMNKQINPIIKIDLNKSIQLNKDIEEILVETKEKLIKLITESIESRPKDITFEKITINEGTKSNLNKDEKGSKNIMDDINEIMEKLSQIIPNNISIKQMDEIIKENPSEDIKQVLEKIDVENIIKEVEGKSTDEIIKLVTTLSQNMLVDKSDKQNNNIITDVSNEDIKQLIEKIDIKNIQKELEVKSMDEAFKIIKKFL